MLQGTYGANNNVKIKVVFRGHLRDLVGVDEVYIPISSHQKTIKVKYVLDKVLELYSALRNEVLDSSGNWDMSYFIMVQRGSDYIQVTLDDVIRDGDTIVIVPPAVGGF
mgnify:CR=1 FL=1